MADRRPTRIVRKRNEAQRQDRDLATSSDYSSAFAAVPLQFRILIAVAGGVLLTTAIVVVACVAIASNGNLALCASAIAGVALLGLIVGGPIFAFAYFTGSLAKSADDSAKVAYTEFAESVNGRVSCNKESFGRKVYAVEYVHGGLRAVIDSKLRRASQNHNPYGCLTLHLPHPTKFQCEVGSRRVPDSDPNEVGDDIGSNTSRNGGDFYVRSNNEMVADQVFDESIQVSLRKLEGFSERIRSRIQDPGRTYVLIRGTLIQVRVLGVIKSKQEMIEFHRRCHDLFGHLLPQLGYSSLRESYEHANRISQQVEIATSREPKIVPAVRVFGACGIVCATLSLITWTILVACAVLVPHTIVQADWDAPPEKWNSLRQLAEYTVTIFSVGVFGLVGLVVGGVLSCVAILTSGFGLAFRPRRLAIVGLTLGAISVIPSLLCIAIVVYVIVTSNG